ncbi:hypothetical protein MG293_018966 [Ovis ammon polii]|uniref:Uncharacterized protein n=1 Tax=Ovis ammon polii TaxID=230172 RepID=A0AAD4TN29_OVIAM|nr:hypothetical protein MG293_018966 [Ovis ammon polii]
MRPVEQHWLSNVGLKNKAVRSLAPSAPSPGLRASSPQLQRTLEMVYRLTLQRRDPWWDSFPQKGIGDLGTPKRWQGTPYSSKRNSKKLLRDKDGAHKNCQLKNVTKQAEVITKMSGNCELTGVIDMNTERTIEENQVQRLQHYLFKEATPDSSRER